MDVKKTKWNKDLPRRSLIILLIMVVFLIIGVLVVSFKNYSFDNRVGAANYFGSYGRRGLRRIEAESEADLNSMYTIPSSSQQTSKSAPRQLLDKKNDVNFESGQSDKEEDASFFDFFIARLLRKIRPDSYTEFDKGWKFGGE